MGLPLHRSTTEKNPTERLMDVIAGEIGFYGPFFLPILHEEISNDRGLKFGTVENIRERFCSEASYQSTLNACVSRMNSPVLLITVGLALKKRKKGDYILHKPTCSHSLVQNQSYGF